MTSSVKRMLLFCDIETFSETDLTKSGVFKYCEDPAFEIMLFGYAYNDDPVKVVDLASGEVLPERVRADLENPDVLKIAHNANFERTCLTKALGAYMRPEEWYCTAVRAATLGLPRSLAGVGDAIGLPEDEKKMAVGKRLVQYFAKPCAPTKTNGGRRRNLPSHEPDKWSLYKEYNKQDVATERAIYYRLEEYPRISKTEHSLWCLDQKINEGGVLVDAGLVSNIVRYSEQHQNETAERAKSLTGMDNPSSIPQIRRWLKARGLDPEKIDKDAVQKLIEETTDQTVKEFLRLRQELGKTSITKYDAIERAMCDDGRIRGMLQFYGANRTGRWAGRIVQLQNLPQNHIKDLDLARSLVKANDFETLTLLYDSPSDIFSQLIRTALIAGKNKTFVVCDYSAIEARVIAWLAGEDWALKTFRESGKIYEATASQMYGVPVESIKKGSELRKHGKIATLACGYGGGVGALARMDKKNEIREEDRQPIIDAWRNANPHIVQFWYDTEKAMKKAISHPGVFVGLPHGMGFQMIGGVMFATLPSGRRLAYQGAKLKKTGQFTSVVYMGQNQTTQKWEEIETYGGRAVENLTQATARDCLGAAMLRLAEAGYAIRMHIHDEVVIETEKDTAEEDMRRIREIMTLKDLNWAAGLPLTADGYTCDYYQKD